MKSQRMNIFRPYATRIHDRLNVNWLILFFLAMGRVQIHHDNMQDNRIENLEKF